MMGFAIAYDPCPNCGKKEMCSMCELTMRRKGAIKDNERELVHDALLELKREIHNRAVHTHTTERVQESDLEEILNKLSQEELAWLAILFLFWGVFKSNIMPEDGHEDT